jgi:hypothetical protein
MQFKEVQRSQKARAVCAAVLLPLVWQEHWNSEHGPAAAD